MDENRAGVDVDRAGVRCKLGGLRCYKMAIQDQDVIGKLQSQVDMCRQWPRNPPRLGEDRSTLFNE